MSVRHEEPIKVTTGRRAPFSQLGDWVGLVASPPACRLYWILSMHVNADGTNEIKLYRRTLAALMGYKDAKAIDRYVTELIDLAAINVYERYDEDGGRLANQFVVHMDPPDEYAGHRSLRDWYDHQNGKTPAQPPVPKNGGGGPPKTEGGATKNGGGGSSETEHPNNKQVNNKLSTPLRGVESRAHVHGHTRVPETDPEVNSAARHLAAVPDPQPHDDPKAQTALAGDGFDAGDRDAKPEPRRSVRLPEDWEPSTQLRTWAHGKGLTDEDVDATVAEFRDFWCFVETKNGRKTPRGWDGCFRNQVRKDLKHSAKRAARWRPVTEMSAEAEAAAAEISAVWWGWWSRKGPILEASKSDLENLVRAGLAACLVLKPLPLAREEVQKALKACERPVPYRDQFQRALLGQLPSGRQPYTGDGWASGNSQAAWAAWNGQGAPPATPPDTKAGDAADLAAEGTPASEPGGSAKDRFMAQWSAMAGGAR